MHIRRLGVVSEPAAFEVYMLAGEPRLYFQTTIKGWGEVAVKDSWNRFGQAQIGVVFNERTEALNAGMATRVRERKLPQGRGQGWTFDDAFGVYVAGMNWDNPVFV
jgi:hypothetical protein